MHITKKMEKFKKNWRKHSETNEIEVSPIRVMVVRQKMQDTKEDVFSLSDVFLSSETHFWPRHANADLNRHFLRFFHSVLD